MDELSIIEEVGKTEMEVQEEEEKSRRVPESVREAVNNTLLNVDDLRSNFDEFLSLSHPDVLYHLPPLQRALSLLTLARATSTLFAVKLRCTGVHPDSHRLKGDLERISRYQDKLDRYLRLSKDPIRPTTKLNFQAANRFIQHSLPDLTAQQTRSLRELGRNEAGRVSSTHTNFQRKRKYQPPFKPTVQASVHEFLQNTALEVFDSKQGGGHKEPVVPILIEDSSEDDDDDELEEDELLIEEEEEVELEDEEEFELELEEDELLDDEEQVVELGEDELLEDNQVQVEEKEKQEIKGPPVFIILDSSDED